MSEARMIVSPQFLRQALNLPMGTEIVYAETKTDVARGVEFEFIVDHPDIKPGNDDDDLIPVVIPHFRRQDPVVFVGWGQAFRADEQ